MRGALISDIHSNVEALRAVLDDIARRSIDGIYCLGDIVGYGPDPEACVDLVQERCRVVLMGNHDEALIHGAFGFNSLARRAIDWTRVRMRPRFLTRRAARRRWAFLAGLALTYREEGLLFVHGSPRDPTSEYILERDLVYGPPTMFPEIFSNIDGVCFVGHTHIPCVISEGLVYHRGGGDEAEFSRGSEKLIVNVGSVGQPRDGDPRACYVEVDGDVFRYHRVAYDVAAVQRKIRSIPDLDRRLAERLGEGL